MLLILALFAVSACAQTADMVVENARIYTANPAQATASAMAVQGSKIIAVGNDVSKHVGPSTKRIDARGSAIVPGFIDSHGHMLGLGEILESFDLRDVKSIAAVADRVRKAAASMPSGAWVVGRAWDQTNWGGKFPAASDLDGAAPNHPVVLKRVDGHASWVNTTALKIAGITKDTQDPAGGKIIRDAAGNPTGVLIDTAQALVSRKIPETTATDVERRLESAARECARLGLTTVHDAGVGAKEIAAYQKLAGDGRMPVRVYAMVRELGDRKPEIGEYLTIRAIKLVADGAMGSRGAAFWQPYSDDPGNTGLLIMSREKIEAVVRQAVARGFQVCAHAIGDRANRTVLDAYAAVLGPENDKRFRVEHAQVVSLPDFAAFAKYNVIASIQSTHATSDMRWAKDRLGPDRMNGAWATKRFERITNGSDFPVESANPIWGFYAAVTRQDHQGNPPGGFLPDQRLSRAEALKSWTVDGAYAAFEEKQKGSLEPGKLADFVVLSKDIMTVPDREILDARVTMTVVGGKVVHSTK